jgi:hypothetical protein
MNLSAIEACFSPWICLMLEFAYFFGSMAAQSQMYPEPTLISVSSTTYPKIFFFVDVL